MILPQMLPEVQYTTYPHKKCVLCVCVFMCICARYIERDKTRNMTYTDLPVGTRGSGQYRVGKRERVCVTSERHFDWNNLSNNVFKNMNQIFLPQYTAEPQHVHKATIVRTIMYCIP